MADKTGAIRVAACGCITPFGDASSTHAALLGRRRALALLPALGREGGDLVPLALLPGRALDEDAPPSWLPPLAALGRCVPAADWGSSRRPVFVTGSNFGVGGLVALKRSGDPSFARWGGPPACTELLRLELGWGPDVSIISHACVSAHLGLLEATRVVEAGLADEALILSFDFLSPFVAGGFNALKILNSSFPSPFMERPAGAIGLGDGAAFAVLSRNRGDWAIEAQSLFNEMHHFTANRGDGSGFAACLGPVAASLSGRKVWYKGHGTGTLEAGRLEVSAAAAAFPEAPIVGWKGSLGHTLGSCGLVELALAIEALRTRRVPGTLVDDGTPMSPHVSTEAFDASTFDGVVCASNAFGGAHAAFLLTSA